MSRAKLYLSTRVPFTGISASYDRSRFVFFGVPYDKTSTYKAGSRFAPGVLRDVSANMELYSVRSGVDLEKVPVHDWGDVDIVESLADTLSRVRSVCSELFEAKKIPIMAGGEHSITKAAADALPKDTALVSFDAHLDLRDEFLGEKLSHATFMRRVSEQLGSDHIMEVGIRAFSKSELDFTRSTGVTTITPQDLRKTGLPKTAERIKGFLSAFSHSYVTVDIDVLDPAFAPGIGNPEPDGLTTDELLTLVDATMEKNSIGLDLVEVSPQLDSGQTAAVGVKVIFEAIAALSTRSHDS
ncbi:MAG TPA: agmatinase [Candidatus Bathyarchaeia archaeon]|nr:agmatinase [Candidatus Bathyarchaeia archaeon]